MSSNLVDGEHVEVGDVVFMSQVDPGSALLLVNQLANIFINKLPLLETKGVRWRLWITHSGEDSALVFQQPLSSPS